MSSGSSPRPPVDRLGVVLSALGLLAGPLVLFVIVVVFGARSSGRAADPLPDPVWRLGRLRRRHPLRRPHAVLVGLAGIVLAGCDAWIEDRWEGAGAYVATCENQTMLPAPYERDCPRGWIVAPRRPEGRDLAPWRPGAPIVIEVDRDGEEYVVDVRGDALTCEGLRAPAESENGTTLPAGGSCRIGERRVTVLEGYLRGEGGTFGPGTHLRLDVVLRDGGRLVHVSTTLSR